MAINDELKLRVVGRYQDQNIVNSLCYRIDEQAASEHEVCQALVDAWITDLKSLWLNAHIDSYELIGVKAFRQTGVAKVPGFSGVGENGAVVGTDAPSPICRTITLYTEADNTHRRGRVMLSGSDNAMFNASDGAVTTAHLAVMQLLADELEKAISVGGDTFQLGLGAVDREEPLEDFDFEPVTYAKARITPSCVRSRRVRQFLIG